MIDAISNLLVTEEPEYVYTEQSNDALGKDEFLQMFLAQLQYQDPMNPMDTQEFSAQLAQYSSLEQLYNVNENLETIGETQARDGSYQALSFMGKEVLASGDSLLLDETGSAVGGISLDGEAECWVSVYDTSGSLVKVIDLGVLGEGRHSFEWDGVSDSGDLMATGEYHFDVQAMGSSGDYVGAETLICGRVDRVNLEGESPLLYVGDVPLGISQVQEIHEPAAGDDEV